MKRFLAGVCVFFCLGSSIFAQEFESDEGLPESLEVMELHEKARTGDVDAMVELCALFHEGESVPRNEEQASRYCLQAMEAGSMAAARLMAFRYIEGLGVPKDVEKGKKILLDGVAAGDSDMLFGMGLAYWLGNEAWTQDRAKGLDFVRQACEKDRESSFFGAYISMLIDEKRYDDALSETRRLCIADNEEENKNDMTLVLIEPLVFFLRDREGFGTPEGMRNPRGVMENFLRLMNLLREHGMIISENPEEELCVMNYLVYRSFSPLLHDPEVDRKIFECAEKIESPQFGGKMLLAFCYWEGIGTEMNRAYAKELIRDAAEKHGTFAPFWAAVLLELPRGPEGLPQAKSWLLQAAQGRSAAACTLLGQIYLDENLDAQAVMLLENAVQWILEEKDADRKKEEKYLKIVDWQYQGGGDGRLELNIGFRTGLFPSENPPIPLKSRPGFHDFASIDDLPELCPEYIIEPADAAFLLADCYRDGRGVLQNSEMERQLRALGEQWQREERSSAVETK